MYLLMSTRIDSVPFLLSLVAVTAVPAAYLLIRKPWRRGLLISTLAAVSGAGAGLLACWLVSDVWNLFGLPLTSGTRTWVAAAFAGVSLAAANLPRGPWQRKIVAAGLVPLVLVTAATGVNQDYGAYRTLGDALSATPAAVLPMHIQARHASMDPQLGKHWQQPHAMPAHGMVGQVSIPGTVSGFPARSARLYLPPAALVPNPPTLPVIMLFPGQPGSPSDVFTSGQVAATYDAYAASHHGLAPIVVAPDQLGSPLNNPMCVDSALGNVATYITVDVPAWLRMHYPVADGAHYWSVGGYSEGGTCAVQFGVGHPEIFGSFVAVLPELQPSIGADTVARGFVGSISAYEAATPMTLMTRHAPYRDSLGVIGTGAQDVTFSRYAQTLTEASRRAGIDTQLMVASASGHDWNTVRYVWSSALPRIADRMGLAR